MRNLKIVLVSDLDDDGSVIRSAEITGELDDYEADPISFVATEFEGVRLNTKDWGYVLADISFAEQLVFLNKLAEEAERLIVHDHPFIPGIKRWMGNRGYRASEYAFAERAGEHAAELRQVSGNG